jgi:putative ABC transport system ATP-binding protein
MVYSGSSGSERHAFFLRAGASAGNPGNILEQQQFSMIELQDLTMSYAVDGQAVDVLRGIDLAIGAGDSVAVIGPSGSGKTTLLLLLAGLEKPSGGSIRLEGVSMAALDADALADLRRDRVGIIFQSFHLVPSLTALGNVALPLEIAGNTSARERAGGMLERVGLVHRARHFPAQLSGGEQQRVAIARALVHSPALVLADEPTGNLDKRTGERIGDMLFELHDESDSTLIVATHDARMARRCDRVLQLDEGRLIQQRGDELLD